MRLHCIPIGPRGTRGRHFDRELLVDARAYQGGPLGGDMQIDKFEATQSHRHCKF
jgi:methylglyoxal synthase